MKTVARPSFISFWGWNILEETGFCQTIFFFEKKENGPTLQKKKQGPPLALYWGLAPDRQFTVPMFSDNKFVDIPAVNSKLLTQ